MATVFLSHSSRDDELARQLESWLNRSGFDDLFVDHTGLLSGDKWTEELRRRKASCRVVICLVTSNWLSSHECFAEFLAGWYAGKRMIPLLVLKDAALDAEQSKKLARILAEDQGADLSRAGAPAALDLDAHPDVAVPLVEGLKAAGALARVGLDPEAFSAVLKRHEEGELKGQLLKPPFPGLKSFEDTDADAAIFYGRDPELIWSMEELRELRTDTSGAKAYVIQGASGSGKSSFMKAGILPRLRRERGWLVPRAFRPGTDPLFEFSDSLSRSGLDMSPGRLRDELQAVWLRARQTVRSSAEAIDPNLAPAERTRRNKEIDAAFLAELWAALEARIAPLKALADRPNATFLFAVDQGEEVARAKGESGDALADYMRAALAAPRTDQSATCLVVLTVRSDSWQELQESARFAGIPTRPYDLRTLPIYRYDNAIERPAARYGVEFEPQLVEALMNDAGGKDALPLLAFTLERLWNQYEKDRRVRKENYESLGRMAGLLRDAAERALRGLDPVSRPGPLPDRIAPARDVLGARTFVPALAQVNDQGSVLRRVAPLSAFSPDEREMLAHFESWRLVVSSGDQVEVAHEALFREWPRFEVWLKPERARLETLRGVESAADTWASQEERSDLLLHSGRRLRQARALDRLEEYAAQLSSHPQARRYLAACRRAQRNRRTLAAGAATALAACLGLGVFLMQSDATQNAVLQHAAAEIREGRLDAALPYALTGLPAKGDLMFLSGHGAGDLVLDAGGDRPPPLRGLMYPPDNSIDFSPDKKWFRANLKSGELQLFDVESWKLAHTFRGQSANSQILITKDNSWAIGYGQNGSIELFDLKEKALIRDLKNARFNLSADESWLFIADPAGNTEVIDLSRKNRQVEALKTLPAPEKKPDETTPNRVICVFTSDNRWLLETGEDGELYQISLTGPAEPKHLGNFELKGPLSKDGRWLIAVNEDRHQVALDLNSEFPPRTVSTDEKQYGEFLGTSTLLKIQNTDGRIFLFDVAKPGEPMIIGASGAGTIDQASSRGRWRAVGSVGTDLWLIDASGEKPPKNLGPSTSAYFQDIWTDPAKPAPEYTIENDRSLIWVYRGDQSVDFYNLETGAAPLNLKNVARNFYAAVSADERWVLSDYADGTARLYDIRSPGLSYLIGTPEKDVYFEFVPGIPVVQRRGGASISTENYNLSRYFFPEMSGAPVELIADLRSLGSGTFLFAGVDGKMMHVSGRMGERRIIGQAARGGYTLDGRLLRFTDANGANQAIYLGAEPKPVDVDTGGAKYASSSDDGRWLAYVTQDGELKIQDLEGKAPLRGKRIGPILDRSDGSNAIIGVTLMFSPKGNWLTARWSDGQGVVFNLKTGTVKEFTGLHNYEVYPAYFGSEQWMAVIEAKGGAILTSANDSIEPVRLDDVSATYSLYNLTDRWMYFVAKSGQAVLVDLENGGALRPVGKSSSLSLTGEGKYLGAYDPLGTYSLMALDAKVSDAKGSKLKADICQKNAAAITPFDDAVRHPKVSTPISKRIAGRPWNPCDWRGLAAGNDGWSQAMRRFDVTVREKTERDFLCGEDAAGRPEAERIRMCALSGIDEKWIAKLPDEKKTDDAENGSAKPDAASAPE